MFDKLERFRMEYPRHERRAIGGHQVVMLYRQISQQKPKSNSGSTFFFH
jgi:hypothetical protein